MVTAGFDSTSITETFPAHTHMCHEWKQRETWVGKEAQRCLLNKGAKVDPSGSEGTSSQPGEAALPVPSLHLVGFEGGGLAPDLTLGSVGFTLAAPPGREAAVLGSPESKLPWNIQSPKYSSGKINMPPERLTK